MGTMGHIAAAFKQTRNRNVFVQRVPVDTTGTQFIAVKLFS